MSQLSVGVTSDERHRVQHMLHVCPNISYLDSRHIDTSPNIQRMASKLY